MRLDSTIAWLTLREMRRMPDVIAYTERGRVRLWDLLAYSALAETGDGRVRLVAILPGHPDTAHPDLLCLDGPRISKHRNPPFEDVSSARARPCACTTARPSERRWAAEHGLLGLFDITRVHVTNEHIWRRTGQWPSEDAPHGVTAPVVPVLVDLKPGRDSAAIRAAIGPAYAEQLLSSNGILHRNGQSLEALARETARRYVAQLVRGLPGGAVDVAITAFRAPTEQHDLTLDWRSVFDPDTRALAPGAENTILEALGDIRDRAPDS